MTTMIRDYFVKLLLLIVVLTGMCSCSKHEFDPDDYATSLISGEYGKNGFWQLNVSVNDEKQEESGTVRFDSKNLQVGDLRFDDVIPGDSYREFKNVPLTVSEEGVNYTIEYTSSGRNITINGVVDFGIMTVSITM